jgi:hypothetical protein
MLGVQVILGWAVYRMIPRALEAINGGLTVFQWASLVLCVIFMGYSEGYRGFQKRFSPRTVIRALYLGREPLSAWTPLAPIVAMGMVRGTRKLLITSRILTAMIITFIVVLRYTPQPWRGIVDAGVVLGLAWGMLAIFVFWANALAGRPPEMDPQFPQQPVTE